MNPILSTLVTQQVLFDGLISGLVFGLLAMGIVLVYRATRVINFAVGNMGIIGAGLIALLVGGSCGMAAHAARTLAHELAGTPEGRDAVVVVILPDSGRGYLTKIFNDDWLA